VAQVRFVRALIPQVTLQCASLPNTVISHHSCVLIQSGQLAPPAGADAVLRKIVRLKRRLELK